MKLIGFLRLLILSMALGLGTAYAVPDLPDDFTAMDTPDDAGYSATLSWSVVPGETADMEYVIEVAENQDGPWYQAAAIPATLSHRTNFPGIYGFADDNINYHALNIDTYAVPSQEEIGQVDKVRLKNGQDYFFKLSSRMDGTSSDTFRVVKTQVYGNYFSMRKLNNFIIMLFVAFFVLFFIFKAKRNPGKLFLRKISGLDAVDEALGRATEMGKPVFFIHGIATMAEIPTIASINILSRVAQKVAEFDTTLKVTNYDPIVMAVSQETVKEAYVKEGRPDAFVQENVSLTAADQFSYAAAVDGMMVREKPAANFFMGTFFAESLLLSETGASTGAIQIAGTDSYTQLPFFVTTCDYTLMGEELYAASAYLSREPKLLGSIKGQDMGKAALIVLIIVGSILSSFGVEFLTHLLKSM